VQAVRKKEEVIYYLKMICYNEIKDKYFDGRDKMTTLFSLDYSCAICGHTTKFYSIGSTTIFGYMDLDTRPAELKRSTLVYDVQMCPKCHYANYEISDLIVGVDHRLLTSDRLKSIISDDTINDDIKKFIIAATLYELTENYHDAAYLYLNTAWLYDDITDLENSIKYRKLSIEMIKKYLTTNNDDHHMCCLLVDLLRRTNDYSQAITVANDLVNVVKDELLKNILNYQIELCIDKDNQCHSLGEIF